MTERVRLTPPHIDKGAVGWMMNYARRNYWRVSSWMELDDLWMDGYMIYYEAVKRYPTAIERPHIMRLYMLCYRSHIERLVKAGSRQLDYCIGDIFEFESNLKTNEMATFATMIDKAPPYIKDILKLFTSERGRHQLQTLYRMHLDGHRETTNERLRRLIRLELESRINNNMASAADLITWAFLEAGLLQNLTTLFHEYFEPTTVISYEF